MKRYTRKDLAKEMQAFKLLPYRDASALVTLILECIKRALKRGQTVEFNNFGVLDIQTRQVRMNLTQDPTKKGQKLDVRCISFRPAKYLKNLVKEGE